jgi:MtN3 and saliva related transmembrane protein
MAEGRSSEVMLETVLGGAAAAWGVLMAISPALQIRKMLLHRSSREVSIAYFWVLLVGFVLWIGYGLTIENWFLVVPNAVAFTVCATTIAVALRYRLSSGGGAFDTAA